MLQKLDKTTRRSLEKGNLGESFIRWWCQESNITYKKATFEENNYSGIDAYIENIPTDIKNTRGIYFGRVYKDSGSFYVRHPFRINTKCIDYLILEIENNKSFTIQYHGSIKEHLLEKYFCGEIEYNQFLKTLQEFDKLKISTQGYTIDSFFFNLKKIVSNYLKPNILCHYNTINNSDQEVSIKLISKEDKEKENSFISEKRNT